MSEYLTRSDDWERMAVHAIQEFLMGQRSYITHTELVHAIMHKYGWLFESGDDVEYILDKYFPDYSE